MLHCVLDVVPWMLICLSVFVFLDECDVGVFLCMLHLVVNCLCLSMLICDSFVNL